MSVGALRAGVIGLGMIGSTVATSLAQREVALTVFDDIETAGAFCTVDAVAEIGRWVMRR